MTTETINRPSTDADQTETELTDVDSLSVSTDTVTFAMTPTQAKQFAAIGHAASGDQNRPTICAVRIRYGDGELEAAATDSYRLAWRAFAVVEDLAGMSRDAKETSVTYTGCNSGEVLIPAKPFLTAVATVVKGLGVAVSDRPIIEVAITPGDRDVTVSTTNGASVSVRTIDASYPKIDRFKSDSAPSDKDYAGTMPAFHIAHLDALIKSAGYTAAQLLKAGRAIQFVSNVKYETSTEPANDPIRIKLHGDDSWNAILMPVRV